MSRSNRVIDILKLRTSTAATAGDDYLLKEMLRRSHGQTKCDTGDPDTDNYMSEAAQKGTLLRAAAFGVVSQMARE
jgi:hypothetical protein